ncbi:MAG: hypothetical protein KDD37_10590 [Bdellovibrionales bacterium]|nr:hypothetical protein [Bdellovibrionales bacterium]
MNVLICLLCLFMSASAFAGNCRCIYKSGSPKQATQVNKHWWGTSMKYYCDYTCYIDGKETTIRANHSTWWTGKEQGNEFICEGTVYKEQYSTYSNWFYYSYVKSNPFEAEDSETEELQSLAKSKSCR